MIVTVTPNPSVDRTLAVGHLVRGQVHRSGRAQVDAGGKGINVARALVGHGVAARAVLPVGGAEGRQLVDLLTAAGVDLRTTAIAGAVRANVAVVEPDGTTTKVNEAGPVLSPGEVADLLAATRDAARGAGWVVCCGSLPEGVPAGFTADVVAAAHAVGACAAVDTSGAPLLAALAARPDLLKPNLDELAEAVGAPITTLGDAIAAAAQLQARGARAVLASLGGDGAVLVADGVQLHAEAPGEPVSTVGAGDAALAGYLSCPDPGADPEGALRAAVAWGTAAACLPGSTMPGPGDVHPARVVLTGAPDLARPLQPLRRRPDDLRVPVA